MQLFHSNNGKKSLIIFFSGWALDFSSFAPQFSSEHDLLFVWDYRNTDFTFDFSSYSKIISISYSYGVFMSQFVDLPQLKENIAINGTPYPINKTYGISPKMFELTLKTLNEKTIEKFYKNMFLTTDQYDQFTKINTYKPTITVLKDELENIKNLANTEQKNLRAYTKAIISTNDRIFPSKAQLEYWKTASNTKTLEISSGHFPFIANNMKDLIFNG